MEDILIIHGAVDLSAYPHEAAALVWIGFCGVLIDMVQ